MTDQLDDHGAEDGADIDIDEMDHGDPRFVRVLRERAKSFARENGALIEENRKLRVDAALRDLNLTETQREALLAVHKGDIDADAYRETAEALSFLEPDRPTPDEIAAHRRMQEATTAAPPSEAFIRTLTDELLEAKSSEQLTAILQRQGMIRYE
jgi:hypothetical protein